MNWILKSCGANKFFILSSRLHMEVISKENTPSLTGVCHCSNIKKNGHWTAPRGRTRSLSLAVTTQFVEDLRWRTLTWNENTGWESKKEPAILDQLTSPDLCPAGHYLVVSWISWCERLPDTPSEPKWAGRVCWNFSLAKDPCSWGLHLPSSRRFFLTLLLCHCQTHTDTQGMPVGLLTYMLVSWTRAASKLSPNSKMSVTLAVEMLLCK